MPIPSHSCRYTVAEALRRFIGPALGTLLGGVILHLADSWSLLPAPVPADIDRTVLAAKVRLASRPPPASIVLVGDSSCMMDLEASTLGQRLAGSVLNLGTLSFLDLRAHAALLRRHLQTHATAPRDVVLVLHPASLRRTVSEPGPGRFFDAQLASDPRASRSLPRNAVEAVLGGVLVREQLVQSWVPTPLRSDFARAYGTTWQLARLLDRQSGSLTDPTPFHPEAQRGRYEGVLPEALEAPSREFRAALPPETRLWVALTPVPESLALPGHRSQVRALLQTWSAWLQPAQPLEALPAVLPDARFATATHLNAEGAARFTDELAEALAGPNRPPAPR